MIACIICCSMNFLTVCGGVVVGVTMGTNGLNKKESESVHRLTGDEGGWSVGVWGSPLSSWRA